MAARNVGSVVVVDNIGYVSGIITDRDIAVRGVGFGYNPDAAVEEIMTRDVAAVSPLSDASEAAAIMQKRSIRRVPVIDDSGRVHGMVTMDDLVRHLTHEADALANALVMQDVGLGSTL